MSYQGWARARSPEVKPGLQALLRPSPQGPGKTVVIFESSFHQQEEAAGGPFVSWAQDDVIEQPLGPQSIQQGNQNTFSTTGGRKVSTWGAQLRASYMILIK